MLKTQEYLRSGKTLEDLEKDTGIEATHHPILPLIILNYSQINSNKTEEKVRECRGLVLEKDSWNLIARSFPRFFNIGECEEEFKLFNWNNFISTEKADGSLIIIYWYKDRWMINTRGSFGTGQICEFFDGTWQDIVFRCDGFKEILVNPNRGYTYVCELCSPYNKIVRAYEKPQLFLLSIFEGENELSWDVVEKYKYSVDSYKFESLESVQQFIKEKEESDKTYEGLVLRDDQNRRWKIKSSTYLALHRLKGNGNIFAPKNLLPFVLSGESDELLVYYKECETAYRAVEKQVNEEYANLRQIWETYHATELQKDFAQAIVPKTKFASLLFTLRKKLGNSQTEKDLKEIWRNSEDLIVKVLYK